MIKPLTCILISDTIIPDRKFIGNKSNKAKQFDLREEKKKPQRKYTLNEILRCFMSYEIELLHISHAEKEKENKNSNSCIPHVCKSVCISIAK